MPFTHLMLSDIFQYFIQTKLKGTGLETILLIWVFKNSSLSSKKVGRTHHAISALSKCKRCLGWFLEIWREGNYSFANFTLNMNSGGILCSLGKAASNVNTPRSRRRSAEVCCPRFSSYLDPAPRILKTELMDCIVFCVRNFLSSWFCTIPGNWWNLATQTEFLL